MELSGNLDDEIQNKMTRFTASRRLVNDNGKFDWGQKRNGIEGETGMIEIFSLGDSHGR